MAGDVGECLLERAAELGALDAAVSAAAAGDGRLVVIEGPPGIGKTALLGAARERARAAGLRVLAARGAVLERDHPFGAARRLLGLEPDPGEDTAATLEALLRSLRAAAESGSLLLAVDDAQWADAGSLRFLCYLAARLRELPVALAVAHRPREPGAHRELLAVLATEPEARLLRPATLSAGAVATLLPGAGELAGECHRATGGNPFLLGELAGALAAAGGERPALDAERLAELAPEGVARSLLLRLELLPAAAARVAHGLAVLGGRAEPAAVAALVEVDDAEAGRAADLLGDADVILRSRPLEFRHPLVRATVYRELPPSERERLHARAARLLAAAEPLALDAVAAHLLRTDPAGDPWVTEWLGRAAERALAAAAPETAIAYLRRARAEPPPRELRIPTLLALGEAEARCGHAERAIEVLGEALAEADGVAARAPIALRLSRALILAQRGEEAVAVLEAAIAGLPAADRELGLELEAELRLATVANPDAARMARGRPPRFQATPRAPRSRGERLAVGVGALEEWTTGSAERAAELARRALGEGALLELVGAEGPTFMMTAAVLYNCGHHAAAERALTAAVGAGLESRSVFGVALSRGCRAEARQRMGMLAEAEQDASAGLEAARLGMRFGIKTAAASLLVALVEQGRLRDAQAVLAEHGLDGPLPDASTTNYLQRARARLRLEQGDPEGALADQLECARRDREYGFRNPIVPCWPSSEAVALQALGREEEARARAGAEVQRARAFGSARELGIALTVAGQVGGEPEALGEAVAVLARSDARVEHARALACLGAARRRAGRRREARAPLHAALRLARACGAVPLAARADEELSALGVRSRKILRGGPGALTPSERRVARLAAEGLSNPEIARELVVSPRTVETHLSRAYQKLDIGGRGQLAAALSGEPAQRDRTSSPAR